MIGVLFQRQTAVDSQEQLDELFPGRNVTLAAGGTVVFEGKISLGQAIDLAGVCEFSDGTQIQSGSQLTNVKLGRENTVRAHSVMSDAIAGDRNLFGPFCFIRDGCTIGNDCILGAHVEVTRSSFASGVKVSHRAFIGDATIGDGTIIGAGTVFCNFDGSGRQSTTVRSGVTVGSGSLLIPPLEIGNKAVIGAGSVVTRDVPAGSLMIQKR